MNNQRANDQNSLNNYKSKEISSIDRKPIQKASDKNNSITNKSYKFFGVCYENDPQNCIYPELNKIQFIESKKSLDDVPNNIFSNIKSRNKNSNKNYEIKSINVKFFFYYFRI